MNAPANAFSHIIQQMADNASFLWILRGRQRREPHVYPEHIAELDGRIQANLDGLLLYGEDAWAIAVSNGEFPQGGEAFCLGYLAFHSEDVTKIQYATEFALQNDETFKGLVSALAWLPGNKIHPWIKQFFHSKNFEHKRLALAACRVRKEDPAGFLNAIFEREDCIGHSPLLAEALRTAGYFKRTDLIEPPNKFLAHPDPQVAFWAIYCCTQLGKHHVAEQLKPLCTSEEETLSFLAPRALFLSMYYLPLDVARAWIGEWVAQGCLRAAVQACGLLGDPQAVPWLLEQMTERRLNRIAAEAIFLITGQPPAQAPAPELIDQEEEDNLDDDSLFWADPNRCAELYAQGSISTVNHFNAQVRSANLQAPFLAMRYQHMAQWLRL